MTRRRVATAEEDAQAEEQWDIRRRDESVRGFRMALAFASVGYPAFAVLDIVAAPPELLWMYLGRRLVMTIYIFSLWPLSNTAFFRRHVDAMSALASVGAAVGVGAMIWLLGGFFSPYYAGLSLIVLVMGMLMLWPLRVAIATNAVIVLSFVLPHLHSLDGTNLAAGATSTFFLVATAVFVTLGQWARYRASREETLSRAKLERLRSEAEETSRRLDAANHELSRLARRLEGANRTLERQVRIDPLTQIANRRAFDERVVLEWDRARRDLRPLAVVVCDVDYFKSFNDRFGHGAGDECLRAVAGALDSCAQRPTDLAARLGGEEFVLLLADTDLEGATIVAERARAAIAALDIPHATAIGSTVSASFGVAVVTPDEGSSFEALLRKADAGLYRAKDGGRNCVMSDN